MSGGKLIAFSIILFVNFIIEIFFTFKSSIFIREFILFWIFFFASIILLFGISSKSRWAYPGFAVFFALQFLNFIYLYYNLTGKHNILPLIALFFSSVGFLIAVYSISMPKKAKRDITEKFDPGKYLASKTGSVYHAPKCDWAKKIKEESRVWLNSEEEAKEKGYKKHSCLE